MKKLFTILCAALLSAGMWADTAVLSMQLGANGAEAAEANSITGAAGSQAEGWTIAMTGNTEKNFAHSSKPISCGSESYIGLKNSNGVQITVTAPAGIFASKVEFYAHSNDNSVDAELKEFDGNTCSDAVTAHKSDYANPTYIAKELATPKNQFTFTFGGKQACFVAIVTYAGNTNPNCAEPQIAFGDWNDTEEGFPVTITTNEAGVTLSYKVDDADYVTYTEAFYVGSKAVVSAKASKEGYNDAIATATAPLHSIERQLTDDSFAFAEGDPVAEGMRIIAPSVTLVLHDNAWKSPTAETDIEAPEDFGYTAYVAGTTNPSPKDGSLPTAGCFYTFESKADGVLKVAAKMNGGKELCVATADEQLTVKMNGSEVAFKTAVASASVYGLIEFAVKKDATYYVWAINSKIPLFGFEFAEGEDTAVESTMVSTKAVKAIRNGQVVILRDGVEYSILGTQF
ncbi:MAG: hypothetical protein IJT12_00930 [Paludibacteraceae bacterium]|nr:hypothetical protein [Paludibacteraceae bacterium]